MKKSLIALALILGFTVADAQTLRRSVVDNFGAADSLSVIMTRGTLGPPGYSVCVADAGDTLTYCPDGSGGAVTSVGATTPVASSGGTTPTISVGGLTTNGTNLYFVTSTGSGWQYEAPTGTSSPVRATSPTLVTPNLGTPSAVTLTNGTGLPISTGVSGLGTNVATWLGTPSSANLRAALTDEVGTGAAYFVGGALGTPASVTLTNGTGLPLSGLSGLASGMATWLGSATSSNLRGTLTDETGTGVAVFNISPTFTGIANFETINVDSLNAGVITGAVDLDSAILVGLTPGNILTVNGDGKIVDNSAVKVGSSQLAFFNGTLRSKITLDCPSVLADFNPVTNTEEVRGCLYSLVQEVLRSGGYNLVN